MKKIKCLLAILCSASYFATAQNVGIGTTTPNAPLQLSNALTNRKIVLFENTNNDHQYYGFGINGGALRYQVDAVGADHVFYAGADANNSNELFRIKGNGNIGIGTSSPFSYGHGGSNKVLELRNDATNGNNVQAQFVLSSSGTAGFLGGITWAGTNLTGDQRTGFIGNSYETVNQTRLAFFNRDDNGVLGERLSISGNGRVGIGIGSPDHLLHIGNNSNAGGIAGLRVEGPTSTGGKLASFGGFGSFLIDKPGIAGGRLSILENGFVGIGINDPAFVLDVNGRVRIRAAGATSGIWFNNSLNTQIRGLIGMADEDAFGLYGGAGAGWGMTISTTSGNTQIYKELNVALNTDINGYTRLGEQGPAIKTKYLTGTTSAIPAGFSDIPHGLDKSKIIGISVLVISWDGVDIGPGYFPNTGLLYNFQINSSDVRITNPILPTDFALVAGRPVKILLTYQE